MLPIVLHHGFLGFGNFSVGGVRVPYFSGGIEGAIAQRGHPLVVSNVHPTAGIETRARQLKETILGQLESLGRAGERVMILAYSMGGLDALHMISCLGMEDHVAALATISTPHRGSPYADWCLRHLGQRLGGLELMSYMGLDVQAVTDLTTESCRQFNQRVADSPKVRYYSVGGSRPWHRVPAFMMHAHQVVFAAEGENDSLVSVKSSKWGKHLGVWPADHLHLINKRLVVELKEPTGNIVPYYMKLLDAVEEGGVVA